MKLWSTVLLLALLAVMCSPAWGNAASIFLTGHDPDFHAFQGGNAVGAQDINHAAINFITDPAFNPYAAGGVHRFLFVQASAADITAQGLSFAGHSDGTLGLNASGYVMGVDYDVTDAAGLAAALTGLGTVYDAIVIGSDFGGWVTQQEINALDANSAAIIAFLNSGGGLYAMSEGGAAESYAPLGGWYGFLPCFQSTQGLNQGESGFTVTSFGASLGLTNGDVNGNASHNIFPANGACGLSIVDMDPLGEIISLAGRGQVTGGGVTPEPFSLVLVGSGLLGLASRFRNKA